MANKNYKNSLIKLYIPSSRPGLLSLLLFFIAFFLLITVFPIAIAGLDIEPYESFAEYPILIILTAITCLLVVGGVISGILAIWKHRERAGVVITPIILSLTMILAFAIAVLTD